MESIEKEQKEKSRNQQEQAPPAGLSFAAGTAIVAACLAVGYGYHQQTLVGQLTGQQEKMSATVGQLQGQIESLPGN